MYVPSEAVYYEAVVRGDLLDDESSALGYATARRVIPVSPHTFYAYLSAVLHGLKGLRVEERAREIQGEIAALGIKFDRLWSAYDKVGTHLGNATRQFAESEQLAEKVREGLNRVSRHGDETELPALEGGASAATHAVDELPLPASAAASRS